MAVKDVYAYVADDGDVKRIRLSNEFAEAGSFSATTGFTDPDFVKVSKTNREFGLRPRGVRVRRRGTNGLEYRFVPMATEAAQDAAVAAGTLTIGANTWTVTSAVDEDA